MTCAHGKVVGIDFEIDKQAYHPEQLYNVSAQLLAGTDNGRVEYQRRREHAVNVSNVKVKVVLVPRSQFSVLVGWLLLFC